MHPPTKRQIARAAWFSYKVSKGAHGEASETMLGMVRPPSGFVAIELGFGFGEGPSIMATLSDVMQASRVGRVVHGDRTRSKREVVQVKQRENATQRQARLRAVARPDRSRHADGEAAVFDLIKAQLTDSISQVRQAA